MNLIGLLEEMNVLCRDNGKVFTDTQRLDVIEEKLRASEYLSEKGNLFRLYSKKPISEIEGRLLLVSSHVDCEAGITECFSREEKDDIRFSFPPLSKLSNKRVGKPCAKSAKHADKGG